MIFFSQLVIALTLSISLAGQASPSLPVVATAYYGGTVRVIALSSGQSTTQQLIMARTVDPQANLITEDACIQTPGQPAEHSPTYIIISNNSATLSDSPPPSPSKTFTGTGELFGPSWNWTYLKYKINFPLPSGMISIADDNFVTPTQFIARKQLFFTPKGAPANAETVIQLWDAELNPMTRSQYQAALTAMSCP